MIVIFRAAGRQTVGCIQPRETILKSQPGRIRRLDVAVSRR